MAIILGIDPGSRITGFGIIATQGRALSYVSSGCIRVGDGEMPERLFQIHTHIQTLIEQYAPQEFAIEQAFMGRNADSALKLGQARGVAILAARQAELPIGEYAPRAIKQAVVGNGNADKSQVQHMVQTLLKLPGLPQADAADALAIAICHSFSQHNLIANAGFKQARRGRATSR